MRCHVLFRRNAMHMHTHSHSRRGVLGVANVVHCHQWCSALYWFHFHVSSFSFDGSYCHRHHLKPFAFFLCHLDLDKIVRVRCIVFLSIAQYQIYLYKKNESKRIKIIELHWKWWGQAKFEWVRKKAGRRRNFLIRLVWLLWNRRRRSTWVLSTTVCVWVVPENCARLSHFACPMLRVHVKKREYTHPINDY